MTRLARIAATLRKRLAHEGGAVLVVVVVMLPVLIASVVIAIDLGTLFQAKQQAQTAADAGALAGAQDIYNNNATSVTTDSQTLAGQNDAGSVSSVATDAKDDPSAVQVTVSKTVPLEFANLLGIHAGNVSATAIASSNIADALGYFGTDDSDLNDGSQTGDGWTNFCADDTDADTYDSGTGSNYKSGTDYDYGHTNPENGFYQSSDNGTDSSSPPDPNSPEYSTYPSDDPGRCPPGADANQHELDNWQVIHGGVDVSATQFPSPPGTTDQMVDLTGTCVEAGPANWPIGNGATTITQEQGKGLKYDGYCENNADGEIQDTLSTSPGQVYTVSFQMTQNDGGAPYIKQMLALVSDTNLATLPPAADTNGNDCITSSCGIDQYGTTYPLESTSAWNTNSDWLYRNEYTYAGPAGNTTWEQETFTFTADADTSYLAFASLDNCVADWNTTTEASPASTASVTPAVPAGSTFSASNFSEPTDTVNALNGGNECFFGPALSDVTVTNNGVPVALSQ